jgi:hypothetical protein
VLSEKSSEKYSATVQFSEAPSCSHSPSVSEEASAALATCSAQLHTHQLRLWQHQLGRAVRGSLIADIIPLDTFKKRMILHHKNGGVSDAATERLIRESIQFTFSSA